MSAQPINKKLSCIDAVKRRRGKGVRPAVPSTAIVRSCRDRSGSMSSYGATSGVKREAEAQQSNRQYVMPYTN